MAQKKKVAKDDAWGEYESPSQEALKKAKEQVSDGGSGGARKPYVSETFPLYRSKEGDNQIRIVPPKEQATIGMWGIDIYLHRGIGPNRDVYLCPAKMWGEACPVCVRQTNELWETDRDKAKSLYPDYKVLTWVVDRKADDNDKLLLFAMPKTIAEGILSLSNRKESNVMIDVAHPTTGRDVFFERYKDAGWTKYRGIQVGEKENVLPTWAAEQRETFEDIMIKPDPDEFEAAVVGGLHEPSEDTSTASDAPTTSEEDDGSDELDRMEMAEMKALIKETGLDIKMRKDWDESDVRAAIRKAISPEPEPVEKEEVAAEPEEKPVKLDRAELPEDIAECFEKEFDEYVECDDCPEPWRAACQAVCKDGATPLPKAKGKPAEEEKPAAEEDGGRKALMDKIQGAINKKKAE
jgi:hypothetical protein